MNKKRKTKKPMKKTFASTQKITKKKEASL